MQADLGMDRMQILEYVRSIIPITIQLVRDAAGKRTISAIKFRPSKIQKENYHPLISLARHGRYQPVVVAKREL